MRVIWSACLMTIIALTPAYGWSQEGHSIIAEIAQHRLDDGTVAKIQKLLGRNVSLASIASWADDVRDAMPSTARWHFIRIPYDHDTYDPTADCKEGNCVVDVIARFKSVLSECSNDQNKRAEALKFIVHFVGDIHQPLHTADRTDPYTGDNDRGGDLIMVTFFGESTNLHSVWDSGLISRIVHDWGAYVVRLEENWLPTHDLTNVLGGSSADWATEAHSFARDVAYDYPDDNIIGPQYLKKSTPVIDRQIALAGVRLAQFLKEIFQSTSAC